jgi:hypothetical protein
MLKGTIGLVARVLAALPFVWLSAGPAGARATVTHDNFFIDITDFTVDIPCVPETAHFNGRIHVVTHTTETSPGHFLTRFQNQPAGVSGVGDVTGNNYRLVGITQETRNSAAGIEDTFISNFNAIGQGPGNNATVHTTFHFTVNANGELTASVSNFNVECR